MNWFYAKDGQQAGPVDDAELARLVQTGFIADSTLVWHSGLANWQPYASIGAGGQGVPAVGYGGVVSLSKTAVPAGQVQCSQCGRNFAADDVVRIGNADVCAECKPMFIQRLREGAVVTVQPYAGFWIRFGAALLDYLILVPLWAVYLGVFFIFLLPRIAEASRNAEDATGAIGFQIVNLALSLVLQLLLGIYSAYCVSRYGGTPGKRICKLRVVRSDGTREVAFWRAVGRYFSKAFISKIFLVGYIFIIFDDRKRGLHDMICDTCVVHDLP